MAESPFSGELTYPLFHAYYTIPLTFVLWIIVRPFLNTTTWITTCLISFFALTYTTPWDNLMVMTNTWSFPDNAILMNIGYVPVEEYFFFVIQTVMVIFWSILCLRWKLPALCLSIPHSKAWPIRWIPATIMAVVTVLCWINLVPETPPFYFLCVIGWTFPVITFLWIGTGNYIVQRFWSIMAAIIPPTLYLIYVDSLAINAGVWIVNPKAVVGIYYGEMPIEEMFFFLIVNVVIVFGFCAVEKAMTILHNFPEQYYGNIIYKLLCAFFTLESTLEQERIDDLRLTLSVLHRASKSFWAASHVFPAGLRQDLGVLYSFCRVTDDMVDDLCLTQEEKREKLNFIRTFLDKLFETRKHNPKDKYSLEVDNSSKSKECFIDWNYYEGALSREELGAFRSLSRIASQIPAEPLYELCQGYEWDITKQIVKTEDHLIEYSEYVASSVGVLCTFIMANESRDWLFNVAQKPLPNATAVISAARQMGVALQLTNIARDIVTDSETLGRVYIPKQFMDESQFEALTKRRPWTLGEPVLQKLSVRILDLADNTKATAQKGIRLLPRSMWPGIIAATDIYSAIGKVLRETNGYPKRASVSVLKKIWILVRALYFAKV